MPGEMREFLGSRTGRLAATYFAIIMTMTLVFSVILFFVSSSQFDRPLPLREDTAEFELSHDSIVDKLLRERASEARYELILALVTLNVGMALFALWFSTLLARLTMEPIEKAMHEQQRFVSDAAHELRTPLTALRSANEVALRRKNISNGYARNLARSNVEEATKLHDLSSSLLGLINTGAEVLREPVDIQTVVADAMRTVVHPAQKKHITVEDLTTPAFVESSALQLTQLLRILIDNAIKFSPEKSVVNVSGKIQNDDYILEVKDHGIGISDADLPHIYERFYRADRSRSKHKHDGYGIGLSIAKEISDRYEMNLTAKSMLGQGTTFSVRQSIYPKEHSSERKK